MCLNHVGGWFSKTQRDKKFDPGYWIKFLEPPCKSPKIKLWIFEKTYQGDSRKSSELAD